MGGHSADPRDDGEAVRLALSVHGVGLYYHDYETGEHVWCPTAKRIFGVDENFQVDVEKFMAIVHPDDWGPMIDCVAAVHDPASDRDDYQTSYRILRGGQVRWLRATGRVYRTPEGSVRRERGSVRDVSRERELSESLATLQRRQDLGRLTGSIAHEFNNFLTSMLAEASLASLEHGLSDAVREGLASIETAAERASVLTRQLTGYASRQVVDAQSMDLREALERVERLVRRIMPANVELEIGELDAECPVRIDVTQLQQVLMNLVLNASHASQPGQTVRLLPSRHAFAQAGPRGLAAGEYARVQVIDQGSGMTPQVLSQIFEPFYTTKRQGTGLGLPTCRNIVEQLGGALSIESEPGRGTTATFFLPLLSRQTWHEASRPPSRVAIASRRQVIVAEDDPALRSVLARGLAGLGMDAVLVASGNELLARLPDLREGPDAFLLDVVMPGPPIAEVRARLQAERPFVPVVFMSGYPAEDALGTQVDSLLRVGDAFVSKPFTIVSVAQRLREVIADAGLARRLA